MSLENHLQTKYTGYRIDKSYRVSGIRSPANVL